MARQMTGWANTAVTLLRCSFGPFGLTCQSGLLPLSHQGNVFTQHEETSSGVHVLIANSQEEKSNIRLCSFDGTDPAGIKPVLAFIYL
jgi:hypothetical protein